MPAKRLFLAILLVLPGLAGCIPVPAGGNLQDTDFMSSDELREYSTEVFRHQNRVTTRLMMAPTDSDTVSNDKRDRIKQAEGRMYEACAGLNEIASAMASGEQVEMALENEVRKTVRTCDRETRRLEDLLDKHDIGFDR